MLLEPQELGSRKVTPRNPAVLVWEALAHSHTPRSYWVEEAGGAGGATSRYTARTQRGLSPLGLAHSLCHSWELRHEETLLTGPGDSNDLLWSGDGRAFDTNVSQASGLASSALPAPAAQTAWDPARCVCAAGSRASQSVAAPRSPWLGVYSHFPSGFMPSFHPVRGLCVARSACVSSECLHTP